MKLPVTTAIDNQWADSAGHWYCRRTGEPRYRIIGKNGKERNTTLRDARELDLVPSVSTILLMEAKPQLVSWLVTQGMLACLTLPRIADEDDQTFMSRAIKDSRQQAANAAIRGTHLHGLLEESVRQGRLPVRAIAEDEPYILPVLKYLKEHFDGYTWSVERSFSCELGYGGKLDLTGVHPTQPAVVIDYKCKDFADPDKKLHYDEHVTQLAAYAFGLGYINPRCVNLFISSTVPGLIVPIEWSAADINRGYQAFLALLALWKCRKNYS